LQLTFIMNLIFYDTFKRERLKSSIHRIGKPCSPYFEGVHDLQPSFGTPQAPTAITNLGSLTDPSLDFHHRMIAAQLSSPCSRSYELDTSNLDNPLCTVQNAGVYPSASPVIYASAELCLGRCEISLRASHGSFWACRRIALVLPCLAM
jgi:hypothetical protein